MHTKIDLDRQQPKGLLRWGTLITDNPFHKNSTGGSPSKNRIERLFISHLTAT